MAAAYVYVHRRNDTGGIFYVGKGSGRRAWVTQHRNPYWVATVAKAGGYSVSLEASALDDELALLVEMELIDKLRRCGSRLTNLTDGGEGMTGFKWESEAAMARAAKRRGIKRPDVSARLKGVPKSEAHRAALSASKLGTKASEEARRKMSASRKGRPSTMLGKKHLEESKAKISAKLTGYQNPFFGKKHSADVIDRIRSANIGRKRSDESRKKQSESISGHRNQHYGKPVDSARKEKQRASLLKTLAATRVTCPHCTRECDKVNAARWHFDRCKEKK